MKASTLTIGEGSACAFPRQSYDPADATPEQHVGIRDGLYRAARHDGLGEDAAEEAASAMYLHWLSRCYASLDYARGDHLRAFYAIRAYGRRSQWRGFTEQRRAARRVKTAEMLQWRERRRQAAIPQPIDAVLWAEKLDAEYWTQRSRKAAKMAAKHGTTVAGLVAAAYGVDCDRPTYAGHAPLPQPQPWTASDHAAILNRIPARD